jgi:Zn-dependent protease
MRGIISRGGIIAEKAILMLGNLTLPLIISRIFVLLTAFAIHEFAHAWTADRFGDPTPRNNGRLTINPMAHLDPMGSLMLLVVGFGWAKPVPVNPYALARRSSAAMMLVSLAGPASNLLMAIFASIPFQLGLAAAYPNPSQLSVDLLLWEFVTINLLLFLFNLIPISPLDGEKIFYYLLPPPGKQFMDRIRPYGPLILLVLVFSGFLLPGGVNVLWTLYLNPAMNVLMSVLVG